jgi:hypothetical protein
MASVLEVLTDSLLVKKTYFCGFKGEIWKARLKWNNSRTRSGITNQMLRKKKILQGEADSKCRRRQKFYDTTEHITSACPILEKEQYIKRHDRVCALLHFNICKKMGIKLHNEHQYDHVLKLVKHVT